MNLVLIIDDYLPYSTRIGAKMFHELAVELRSRGHNITVITPDFRQKQEISIVTLDGITIWRFRNGPIKDISRFFRAINETLLSYRAWKAIRHLVNENTFDGIIYYSPSIFWGSLVRKLKKRCHCPAYLILRDLFPQWIIDAGMLKQGSMIAKYFRIFEHFSYNQANRIGLMSEKNLEVFLSVNQGHTCEILRNWASPTPLFQNGKDYISIRDRLKLQGKIVFFYGGNIGHAQDMANLMRLTRNMQCHEQAHFLFIGQGEEVELIKSLAEEWKLRNFSYLPSVNQQEFKYILKEVDIGLFSLSAYHSSHNFPGKLLGYMTEALPILGSVNAGNDLLEVINSNEAGFIHINGEDDELFASAQNLFLDKELRKKLGSRAHQLLKEQFSVTSAAQLIEIILKAENAVN
ncbi:MULTISPECIES: glycosyltransferase family 4 protein [Xenorhabdus]|uniref:glycosyltransferase family 4 protein n=1 Tax=Xenorhabdus TaxID=626 RepID=UPI00064ABF66|nr:MULTISPECIES: glycosyltransferase family 4 protein [Xenorhabdus]KLU15998.1 glycosyl transferase [Xenorhabdus griffiniae]KOP33897.1 glycosyl transferase [Xenorhabdus sp. GDc328]